MFGVLLGTLQKFKENSNKEAARVSEEALKIFREITHLLEKLNVFCMHSCRKENESK